MVCQKTTGFQVLFPENILFLIEEASSVQHTCSTSATSLLDFDNWNNSIQNVGVRQAGLLDAA